MRLTTTDTGTRATTSTLTGSLVGGLGLVAVAASGAIAEG